MRYFYGSVTTSAIDFLTEDQLNISTTYSVFIGYLYLACSLSPVTHSCHPAVFLSIKKTPVYPSLLVYGMNPSANSNEQQGDPSWPTENWDNPGAIGTLDQASSQYSSANRLEWEWDPMILAQHPGSGGSADGSDGDRMLKNQISAGTMSSLRASYNNISMLSAGLPSNFTNNHMGIFSPAGIRNFGSLDGSAQLSSSSNLHSVLGPSGIPGLAATSGAGLDNDIRSYDQRQRELFAAGMHDRHVKREEVFDGHARIGLNLGVRTYFSTEETAANRLGKRHRAGSPGSQVPMCQVEGCKADLSTAKQYHRRHKVCELHSKAPNVVAGGQTQRFCQQCSRFHSLGEFDDGKRSCRKRLADHNRRRRKPQPNASTTGGTTAESIGIKSGDEDLSESKSMLMPLKNRSSPSSVSLEDSDEKPSSVGNNLQLRSSGQGFGRGFGDDQHPSAHSGMQMSSQAMTGSDAQALLSVMSPVPLMIQSTKRQMTMMGGSSNHGQDHSVYQQHLQAVQGAATGQTGPKLSLSSLGGQMGLSHPAGGRNQTMSGQTFNGMEPPAVPWLKPLNSRSDLTQVVGRQGAMNLQHLMSTDSKSGITSASANSSNSQEHDVQVFSPSSQNLISRDIASPEWMLGSMTGGQTPRTGSNHFGSSSLNHISGNGQLESGHQIMSLIDSPNQGGGNPGDGGSNQTEQGGHTPMEFMQQHNSGADSGGDNNSRGGGSTVDSPDMKYPELQAMRPYGGGSSSIYDSHHNIMSGNFSYETMA